MTETPALPATDHILPAGASGAPTPSRRARALDACAAAIPAVLLAFFAFQAGGFFPGSTGVAAAALAVLLALRTTLAQRPFAALSAPVAVAAGALAAHSAWVLLSVTWSHTPGRAVLEFNRDLLYLLALLVCGTLSFRARRLAWSLRLMVVAIAVPCAVGWAGRVAPDIVGASDGSVLVDRLSAPLTYWNAQGLFAALGVILAFHLVSSEREPRWGRALGAAALPLLASTLYFTFSRGAFLGVAAGLVAYAVLYHRRGLLTGVIAGVIPTAVALLVSYDADRLDQDIDRADPVAVAQGHEVATAVLLSALGGILLVIACARWLERPLRRLALPDRARRPVRVAAVVAALLLVVVLPVAAGAPGFVDTQYHRFVNGDTTPEVNQRDRILNPGNNGRLAQWRIGLKTWRAEPLHGTGAGTFQVEWNRKRTVDLKVVDGHSLYVETLSDLGLVGFLSLMLALAALVLTASWRALRSSRRPHGADPSAYAVVGAFSIAWAVHAGLDWMWEMPAVTIGVFALGGLALASPVASSRTAAPGRTARVIIALGLLVLAVVPFQVAASQRGLDDAVRAFRSTPQDCPTAIDASLRSLDAVGARPEPWEIIAYCDVGSGQAKLSIQAARNAVARDPRNWVYEYTLALTQGAAGVDPRPAARRAMELNPRELLPREGYEAFRDAKSGDWSNVARRLRLPQS